MRRLLFVPILAFVIWLAVFYRASINSGLEASNQALVQMAQHLIDIILAAPSTP